MAAIFRNHVHCQFYFRGAERHDITMEVIRNRVRQIIGKGVCVRWGGGGSQAPLPRVRECQIVLHGFTHAVLPFLSFSFETGSTWPSDTNTRSSSSFGRHWSVVGVLKLLRRSWRLRWLQQRRRS